MAHDKQLIPKIDSIEKSKIEEITPRYVWIDEDGNQVSPIHREFHSAMTFVNGWQTRWDLLRGKHGRDFDIEEEMSYTYSKFRAMTKTGKPPKELKRVVVRVAVEEPTDEEKDKAKVMLGDVRYGS